MMRQVQSISVLLGVHKAAFCMQHSSSIALARSLATLSVFLPETASPCALSFHLRHSPTLTAMTEGTCL